VRITGNGRKAESRFWDIADPVKPTETLKASTVITSA
jgi:hypothetical protein